jgi:RNA polymerase sigma-70 factor, ECF subfamily
VVCRSRICFTMIMTMISGSPSNGTEVLIHRISGGDRQALPELFTRQRRRLRRMVRLRLDQRLQGRVDPEEVLDEVYRDVLQRAREYFSEPKVSPFVWLRQLTDERLAEVHRRLIQSAAQHAGNEVSLFRGPLPEATSASLAAMLLGQLSEPVHAARRAAQQIRLQETLTQMDRLDREVLVLRHFEMLNNDETAEVLGVSRSEASRYYLRALKLIKESMSSAPGFSG